MPGGWSRGSPRGESKDPPPPSGSRPASPQSPQPHPAANGYSSANGNHVVLRQHESGNGGRSGSGDIELARGTETWKATDIGAKDDDDHWDSKESFGGRASKSMGAKNAKASARAGGSGGGYEVVEREEPLLENEAGEEESINGERLSAGVLLSEGNRSSSLRSHNDRSLGPAFQDRRDSNGNEKPPSHTGGDWRVPEDGHNSGRAGSRADRGRCQLSGRPLVYLCALCSSLCSILLGYDVGVMSGAKEFIKPNLDLSDVQVEVMVGALNLVAAFGALVAGKTADRLGRKPTIAVACAVFIVGAGMMSASHTFVPLLIGRVVTGIGVGCAMVIAPVYITELAPPDVRGMLVSLTDICINLGIVLGFGSTLMCMSFFESNSARWRAMIGIGTLPPALILLCLTMMPESPRWLIARGQDSVALDVLQRVLDDDREAEESLHCISQATQSHEEATWKDVLRPRDRAIKAAMLLGLGLGFFQQASGSEAAVYYTPDVLHGYGWNDTQVLKGNMGVGGCKLLGEVVAFALLDRIGRRPLFVVSSALVTFCLLMVGMAFANEWDTLVIFFWLCMFMFTFSLGLGPVTFVVASEIFPVAVRSKAMSIVIFVNRFMSGIIASSFETLEDWISKPEAFYFFAVMSLISIAFYWFKVPETRGKTLEEIAADLGSASPPGSSRVAHARRGARHLPLVNSEDEDVD